MRSVRRFALPFVLAFAMIGALPALAHADNTVQFTGPGALEIDFPAGPDHFLTVVQTGPSVFEITTAPGQMPVEDSNADGACVLVLTKVECTSTVAPTSITVYAGDGDDDIDMSGVDTPTILHGEGGSDTLRGGSVADVLDGREGTDYLIGSCGLDTYSGGDGFDYASFYDDKCVTRNVSEGMRLSLDNVANDAPENENIGSLTANGVEGIHGTKNNDTLVGGPGSSIIWANEGNDTIDVRDGGSDFVNCGAGTDTVTADAESVGEQLQECETILRPGQEPAPTVKPPVKFTGTVGCPTGQKEREVGAVKLCFAKETKKDATSYLLTGDVNIAGFLFLSTTNPVLIDTKAKSLSYDGLSTITVLYAGKRYPIMKSAGKVNINLTTKTFAINMGDSYPVLEIINGKIKQKFGYLMGNGFINFAVTELVKVQVDISKKEVVYPAGHELFGGALVTEGKVGYSAVNGPIIEMKGCLKGSLPVGATYRVAEITNACANYDQSAKKWGFNGQVKLLNTMQARLGADVIDGKLDAFSAGFNGFGRLPLMAGSYLDGGGVFVGNLQGAPSFAGELTGGWPIVNVTNNLASVSIKGTVGFDTGSRIFTIRGDGYLYAGGQTLAGGSMSLDLGLGSNLVPNSVSVNVNVNALNGFVVGGARVSLSNTGFFASSLMGIGFQPGAQITKDVNAGIERTFGCNWSWAWVPINWCPYVTGLSASAEAAVSNKGVGGKVAVAWIKPTVWWTASNRQFGYDLGITGGRDLASVLQNKPGERDAASGAPQYETAAATKTLAWTIPKDVQLASLQLSGSNTGEIKVVDPSGKVVFDSMSHTIAAGLGFGRDPQESGKASFGLFPPAIKAGKWTVTLTGDAPFTKVEPLLATGAAQAKVTAVAPTGKGVKPSARKLTAGVSKLKISYDAPKGTSIALRATSGTNGVNVAIAEGLTGKGVRTWTVPATWAGKLQILASTQRDGLATDSTTFPTTFTVMRPKLTPVGKVKVVRGTKGAVNVTWKQQPGVKTYEVLLLIGGATKGQPIGATGGKLQLTPRSAAAMRIQVRAVSAAGQYGPWSKPAKLKAVKLTATKKPKKPKK